MRARVVAPLVAAVLGIGGGVATAIVVLRGRRAGLHAIVQRPAAPRHPARRPGLHGRVAPGGRLRQQRRAARHRRRQQRQRGPALPPLRRVVRDHPRARARKPSAGRTSPTSAPTRRSAEPCELRMTPEHRGDFVTVLRSGNEELVKCACALPSTAGPELMIGHGPRPPRTWSGSARSSRCCTTTSTEDFPHDAITGEYDERTVGGGHEGPAGGTPGVLTEPGRRRTRPRGGSSPTGSAGSTTSESHWPPACRGGRRSRSAGSMVRSVSGLKPLSTPHSTACERDVTLILR